MLELRTPQVPRTLRTRSLPRQAPLQTRQSMAIPAIRVAVPTREPADRSRIMRPRAKCSVRLPRTTRRLLIPVRTHLTCSSIYNLLIGVALERLDLIKTLYKSLAS